MQVAAQTAYAESVTDHTTDLYTVQVNIEKLFHKNQLLPRIKSEFMKAGKFTTIMQNANIPVEFGYSLLAQMVLHRRADLTTLVGILRHELKSKDCQDTAEMLLEAVKADLVDFDPISEKFIMRYDISQDVVDELELYQFPLPMVIPPKQIVDNLTSGYLTSRSSVILRDNHHEDDVCLDHLNRVNQVAYTINLDVAKFIRNKWKGLDKKSPDGTRKDFLARVKSFEKYNRTANDVHEHLFVAGNNRFYLTHKYDKRGRVYSVGYHVNPQGNDWNKGVIAFAKGEIVK